MTYDFYPFSSKNIVWSNGNKVLLNEDEHYVGFVCLEKHMVDETLRSELEAQKMVIEGHLCKIEFIYPKLLNQELMPIIKKSRIHRLNNAIGLSKGNPDVYNQEREKIEKQYLKDLEDAGYTHLTFGIVDPGFSSQQTMIDAIRQLEKQLLEF